MAALKNPHRHFHRLFIHEKGNNQEIISLARARHIQVEFSDNHVLNDLLQPGAVHQGIVGDVKMLAPLDIMNLLKNIERKQTATLLIAHKITDPHNIGAMMRSAAVFGCDAIIVSDKGGVNETGALAKAAAGALDSLPLIKAVNITAILKTLKKHGFWCYALAEGGENFLHDTSFAEKSALVFGSEGAGIRRLVHENCDATLSINMQSGFIDSLNVSNAVAISLHHRYISLSD